MIYFIRSGQYVKIGRANDPHARLAALQTAHPTPLKLLTIIEGGAKQERALHDQFRDKRVSREWYDLTDDEVMEIAAGFADDETNYPVLTPADFAAILSSTLELAREAGLTVGVRTSAATEARPAGLLIFIPGLGLDDAGGITTQEATS